MVSKQTRDKNTAGSERERIMEKDSEILNEKSAAASDVAGCGAENAEEARQTPKKKKKGKKIMKIILLSILGIILIIAAVIIIFSKKNVGQMDACVDETITRISEKYKLTPIDAGEYSEMSAYGILKFHVSQYEVENIGNLSVMTVNAGVMQMATIVLSPYEKNLPLMSCDYMYMLSTRKAYIEFYDLVSEKDEGYLSWMERYKEEAKKYEDIKSVSASSGWYDYLITTAIYKSAGTKDDEKLRLLLGDEIDTYLSQASSYGKLTDEEKAAKAAKIKEYSDRLIDEGGVSTSFFKKALGEEKTRAFFDKVFFGSEKYR